MKFRRCHQLFVELDQQPRFDLASLLSGGDGLDRTARWVALAPHLDRPVPVSLNQLRWLETFDDEVELTNEIELDHDLRMLVEVGLLLPTDTSSSASPAAVCDATLREVPWWSPAALAQAHGAWDSVDVQANNEFGTSLSSHQMVNAFGPAPPHEYRRDEKSDSIPLAVPNWTDFDELLARRKTCRNFDGIGIVDRKSLATMLHRVWGAIGSMELAPGAVAVKKSSPAGGGLHAVEAYLLVQRSEDLAAGLYHYLPHVHELELIELLDAEDAAKLAHQFVAGQNWFENVPVMVIMTARFDRLFWKYRRHTKAWRVVHLDVGHLSQTMYLSAADLGLGAFVTAAINDRLIEKALRLTRLREGAIAIVGFGPRSEETTTIELDSFVLTTPSRLARAGWKNGQNS